MPTDRKTLTPAKGITATVTGLEDQMLPCWHRHRQELETAPARLVLYVFTPDEDTSHGELQIHLQVHKILPFGLRT